MLKVVGSALERARSKAAQSIASRDNERPISESTARPKMEHDGRIDCVAGNGVMSELGIGDDPSAQGNSIGDHYASEAPKPDTQESGPWNRKTSQSAVDALPIVIIKNYASKNSRNREDILDALAKWTSRLVEFKVS
jgi:hypothetical protein